MLLEAWKGIPTVSSRHLDCVKIAGYDRSEVTVVQLSLVSPTLPLQLFLVDASFIGGSVVVVVCMCVFVYLNACVWVRARESVRL